MCHGPLEAEYKVRDKNVPQICFDRLFLHKKTSQNQFFVLRLESANYTGHGHEKRTPHIACMTVSASPRPSISCDLRHSLFSWPSAVIYLFVYFFYTRLSNDSLFILVFHVYLIFPFKIFNFFSPFCTY